MELVIRINLDNATFCDTPGQEVARILQGYCKKIEKDDDIKSLFERFNDFNGNRVGTAQVFLGPMSEPDSISKIAQGFKIRAEAETEKETKVLITVEGGIVQGVNTDNDNKLNIVILDFDCNDKTIQDFEGNTINALLYNPEIQTCNPEKVNHYFNQF